MSIILVLFIRISENDIIYVLHGNLLLQIIEANVDAAAQDLEALNNGRSSVPVNVVFFLHSSLILRQCYHLVSHAPSHTCCHL